MNREKALALSLIGGLIAVAVVVWAVRREPNAPLAPDPDDPDIRVRFVCCDDHGNYSPAVYSRCGGGRWAFDTVRKASPYMRANDPGSAAAGLCGYLFKEVGYSGDTVGTLSLEAPPQPGPDGTIDWKNFGGDSDVILINVDKGTARCCFGTVVGQEVHDLPLGGIRLKRP
jgi:hypothetical protein